MTGFQPPGEWHGVGGERLHYLTLVAAGKRGESRVVLFGSNAASDPGWNTADPSRFTRLGVITTGPAKEYFTAAALRAKPGQILGSYRWIVGRVAPVTPLQENTALQELAVEIVR